MEGVAGLPGAESLTRYAPFNEEVHNLEFLDAVTRSALAGGTTVTVPTQEV